MPHTLLQILTTLTGLYYVLRVSGNSRFNGTVEKSIREQNRLNLLRLAHGALMLVVLYVCQLQQYRNVMHFVEEYFDLFAD